MTSGSGITGNDRERKDGKEWLLLLLSLLLAFIIWLLHSLSLQYSVFFEYNVELTSSLEGRSRSAASEDLLIVRGRSEGYYILRQRIGRRKTLKVTAPVTALTHKDGDVFSVVCENIKSNIVEALGGNVDLEFIVTESMDFNFPRMVSKRVPVAPRTSISFDGQYMPLGRIELRPDSVDIYGDARLLETVDSVMTMTISRRVEFSEDNIYYSLNVVRYIEESVDVPVTSIGVPEDKDLIVFPSTVRVTFRRIFSSTQYSPDDFVLAVDYADFIKTMESELIPEPVSVPAGVISWEISPRYVDCILLENNGGQ